MTDQMHATLAKLATERSPNIERFTQYDQYCEVIDCTQTTLKTLTPDQ